MGLIAVVVLVTVASLAVTGCVDTPTPKVSPTPSLKADVVALTVNSATRSAQIGKSFPLQATPSPGKTFLVLDVTVTNLNKNDLYMGNPLYFKLTTSDGTVYAYSPSSAWLENYNAGVSNTMPGERVTEKIAFEIPSGATATKITYGDGFNGVVSVNL